MQDTNDSNDSNEWINWLEEAISKKHIKYYEYEFFSNVQEIGSGGFGKVYRATWRNTHNKYFALKSFFNFNNATIKEIVHELKLHRDVDFHDNIISFYGVTSFDQENQKDQVKKYLLVTEYADGGTLHNYLKEHFDILTWNDKFNLALQLSHAVSCLHDEGIVHRDLHSGNVLIHQNAIKLADFGLSKRMESSTKLQTKLFGVIPYIDPKRFTRKQNNDKNTTQIHSLNEKSDVYSIGVLLWEISSGRPPFYAVDDISLIFEIPQGLREKIVPNTPTEYASLYTECWDCEPDNRPTMNQVVEKLRPMYSINQSDSQKSSSSDNNIKASSSINNSLQGKLSHIIHNFDKMNTNDMVELFSRESITSITDKEKKFSIIVDEIVDFILRKLNKGKEWKLEKQYIFDYFDYLNNYDINSLEIYNWLLNNQNNSNSILLFGLFNYYGIGISDSDKKAFNLFINASEQNNTLAQYYVGLCYEFGNGTVQNEKLAFEFYQKVANKNCAAGEFKVGYFYNKGIGIERDTKLAVNWYEKSKSNGNLIAMYNLGLIYNNGEGVDKNYERAFNLFKESAKEENLYGIVMLGYCYNKGIGTNVNKQEAFELYQRASSLGNDAAQYNLAIMYGNGEGVNKDYDKAFELFEKLAEKEDTNGIMMLGQCYDNGFGTNIDKKKAFKLYQKASNLGNDMAQYNLALMYENGEGVIKDYDKAFKLFEKLAKQGNKDAQNKLSRKKNSKKNNSCKIS